MKDHHWKISNKPHLTLCDVLAWIVGLGAGVQVTLDDVGAKFDVSSSNAGGRLLKLFRGGYLSRKRQSEGPKVYLYRPTALGKRVVEKWRKS